MKVGLCEVTQVARVFGLSSGALGIMSQTRETTSPET
jgi:hypothetical protein